MKKLLSLLLSLSMLASMAVMPAKAAETVMPLNASRTDSEKLTNDKIINNKQSLTKPVEKL